MISLEERERRVRAIREKMEERNIDVLLVSSSSDLTERGKVRYIVNWSTVLFDSYVILPKRGELKFFGHYRLDANLVKKYCELKETYYPPFGENPGSHIAKLVRTLNPKRVGLCGTRGLTAYVYRDLIQNLEGIEIEEATDIIDDLKMVKSQEELKCVEKAAAIADSSMDHFRRILEPGRVERDLIYEVDCEVKKKGVEDSYYFIGSGKIPAIIFPVFAAGRRIEDGDLVIFNAELVGEEGYGTQCVRLFSIGKPGKDVLEAYEILKVAFEAGRKNLVHGGRICDVANAMLEVVRSSRATNLQMGGHMGHGQGLDLIERPFPTPDDMTELKTDMAITLHPQVVLPNGMTLFVANQYIVTAQGGRCLHRTPNEIIIV